MQAAKRRNLPSFRFSASKKKWKVCKKSEQKKRIESSTPGTGSLVVVQFNIWFSMLSVDKRMKAIVDEIEKVSADFVCLQEVKTPHLALLLACPYVRANYYVSDIDGSTLGGYGVVQFSRFPFQSLTLHPLRTNLGRKALLSNIIVGKEMPFTVATAHLESYGKDFVIRRDQMETIFGLLDPYANAIFTADFNFNNLQPEDEAFPLEYKDSWIFLYPNELGITFDCDNPVRNDVHVVKNRIDRILIKSPTWMPTEAQILGTEPFDNENPSLRPSDHYGLMTKFISQ